MFFVFSGESKLIFTNLEVNFEERIKWRTFNRLTQKESNSGHAKASFRSAPNPIPFGRDRTADGFSSIFKKGKSK